MNNLDKPQKCVCFRKNETFCLVWIEMLSVQISIQSQTGWANMNLFFDQKSSVNVIIFSLLREYTEFCMNVDVEVWFYLRNRVEIDLKIEIVMSVVWSDVVTAVGPVCF